MLAAWHDFALPIRHDSWRTTRDMFLRGLGTAHPAKRYTKAELTTGSRDNIIVLPRAGTLELALEKFGDANIDIEPVDMDPPVTVAPVFASDHTPTFIELRAGTYKITATNASSVGSTKITIRSGHLRYRSDSLSQFLFSGSIDNDLFADGDGVYIDTPLNGEELRNPRGEDIDAANKLLQHLNENLEFAGRVADYLELGELMARDALNRKESCGGHFREEYQTPDGEARRDDENFAYVAAWEWKGEGQPQELNKEPLNFEYVHPTQRSYK